MSDLLFPKLRGEGWNVKRTPQFATKVTASNSGQETRLRTQEQPRYKFGLKYNFIKQQDEAFSEFDKLLNFFLAHGGRYESFLFRDPNNYAVTDNYIDTADGSETSYSLSINRGSYREYVQYVNLTAQTVVMLDSVPLDDTEYTILESGELEFEDAPIDGVVISASFEYYYRVRYEDDELEFNEFLYKLHNGSVKLITVLGE